jgi:hypothetical protein
MLRLSMPIVAGQSTKSSSLLEEKLPDQLPMYCTYVSEAPVPLLGE